MTLNRHWGRPLTISLSFAPPVQALRSGHELTGSSLTPSDRPLHRIDPLATLNPVSALSNYVKQYGLTLSPFAFKPNCGGFHD